MGEGGEKGGCNDGRERKEGAKDGVRKRRE